MRKRSRILILLVLAILATAWMCLHLSSQAFAARIGEPTQEGTYRLPSEEVLDDDLVVFAREVYIDGTVNGDVVAAAQYIEVNGVITGDANLAGASINIKGEVKDDARLAGAGVRISGRVDDDVFAAAAGPGAERFFAGAESVAPGLWITDSAQVGGDAYVAVQEGDLAGHFMKGLNAQGQALTVGGQVEGDANLTANRLSLLNSARVAGTLRYQTETPLEIAPEIAKDPQHTPITHPERDGWAVVWVGLRLASAILGFGLAALLVLRFAPGLLARPAMAMRANPALAVSWGGLLLMAFAAVPLASCAIATVVFAFWGLAPAVALLACVLGLIGLLWHLSPLFTGAWLGGLLLHVDEGDTPSLRTVFTGAAAIAFLGTMPYFGSLVYMFSLMFTLGGFVLARRRPLVDVSG